MKHFDQCHDTQTLRLLTGVNVINGSDDNHIVSIMYFLLIIAHKTLCHMVISSKI